MSNVHTYYIMCCIASMQQSTCSLSSRVLPPLIPAHAQYTKYKHPNKAYSCRIETLMKALRQLIGQLQLLYKWLCTYVRTVQLSYKVTSSYTQVTRKKLVFISRVNATVVTCRGLVKINQYKISINNNVTTAQLSINSCIYIIY